MAKLKLSKRLPKDLTPSPFFTELEKAKAETPDYIDMTVSSPVRVGLPIELGGAIDESRSRFGHWSPEASGWLEARKAVAEYYRERGGVFTPGQILNTASTSEAYSVIFKTFCNPGDVILTPMPGYPLLDTLAQLEHLKCAPYFLKLAHEKHKTRDGVQTSFRFVIDTDSLLAAPEKSRILLLVSPHNPTGNIVGLAEWKECVHFCEENDMVLVVDEVFGDYGFSESVKRSWRYLQHREVSPGDYYDCGNGDLVFAPEDGPKCPIIWLNGLSKAVGSPQLKFGWMAFYAPREQFEPMRAALEFVEDAYLSASSCAQALAISLLNKSASYESKVRERLMKNWSLLKATIPSKYCPEVLGGWYAVLHLGEDDEELTLRLLREKHVLVQPGFFFDFEEDGWVVISLLQESDTFAEAIRRIAK